MEFGISIKDFIFLIKYFSVQRNSIMKVLYAIQQVSQGSVDQTDIDIIHLNGYKYTLFLKLNAPI